MALFKETLCVIPALGTRVATRAISDRSCVTTTSVTPEGNVKQTTEDTRYAPDGSRQQTTSTTINGTVQAYEAGKTLTLVQPDGTRVTYLITNESRLPEGMAIGKTVTIVPVLDAKGRPVADVVTYEIEPAPQN